MNQKTREMIEKAQKEFVKKNHSPLQDDDFTLNLGFQDGSKYGYALAVEQAQVLVEAGEDLLSDEKAGNIVEFSKSIVRFKFALAAYKKLTEGE